MTRRVPVNVSHLEMTAPGELRPAPVVAGNHRLQLERGAAAAEAAEEMYRRVGAGWHWRDRLKWDRADWSEAVVREGVELWTLREQGNAIGYFELDLVDGVAEIRYFGLAPEGIGRGLGGWMLTRAVERGWELGASRIVLNTCTLDGPAALPNYLARGFRVVSVDHQERELPE
ncbi:MAG: GNAT family N-acetyltransferase [Gemmatimonadota bacterium]